MNKFSHRLKKLREKENMSREILANKLGVSYSTIAKYESGVREPDFSTLEKLSSVLDVTVDYLLGKTDKEQGNDFDPIAEHNRLLEKYGIEDSGFFDIEKWKEMTPEQLRELESYFNYIYSKSKGTDDSN
ncbi:helix-turn-helix domain-containing protein [Alkalibacillus salilacus]|uniref:Transcriptional regulator with XRE-family HTH domain n=1 Tax=Alkalibacillus salilacus TaxID=284582 RepID=A0ABT9VD75_9BACI|nr:helix-turn-helix transcriptional regulator [Alkalibacillus salilacus]MDQ0158854.1 transcriptional regulator with XRE-family HTH domain [Alkalibacillus salilacus]